MKRSVLKRDGWLVVLIVSTLAGTLSTAAMGQDASTPAPQISDEQRAELVQEQNRLWGEALSFRADGKNDEAIATAERVLAIQRQLFGEANVYVASMLGWLYQRCMEAERYDDARQWGAETVEVHTVLYGEESYRVAAVVWAVRTAELLQEMTDAERTQLRDAEELNRSVIQLSQVHREAEAIEGAAEVLEIRRKLLGAEHPDTAVSLQTLGSLYTSTADYDRAEPLLQQALDILRTVLGEKHPDTVDSLYNLGRLYTFMGGFTRAEPLFQQVLDIRREDLGEDHPLTVSSLDSLASLYHQMGDFARAMPFYDQALDIRRKILGEEHALTAASQTYLGSVYIGIGDYARAEPLLQQSLDTRRSILGEEHPDTALSRSTLASLYTMIGDYAAAEPLLQQALDTRRNVLGEDHPDTADSLSSLGSLYAAIGDYVAAEPLLQQALNIRRNEFGEEHRDTAVSLSNLGSLYKNTGDYARAEPLLQQALDIRREVLGDEHPKTVVSLNNLGNLYHSIRDYAGAETMYQRALTIHRGIFGEEHPNTAVSLLNLGTLYQFMGDHARAEQLVQQGVDIQRKVLGKEHPVMAAGLMSLGTLYHAMGDHAQAEQWMQQALEVIRNHIDDNAVTLSERQQLVMAELMRHYLEMFITMSMESVSLDEETGRQVLAWKGATLARQRAMRLVAEDEGVADRFTELQGTTMRLASLSRAYPDDPEQVDVWTSQVADLAAEKERLEIELNRESAVFHAERQQITLEDLLSALPEDAVLIDFLEYSKTAVPEGPDSGWTQERSLVAFVIQPGETPVQMFDLGPAAPLSEAVDTWRATFGMSPQGLAAGRQLREAIWEPLLTAIGDAETILVSVDGFLGRLPLGALPGREPGTFLLEDHRLAVIPVPRLLPALINGSGRGELVTELLLLGDVDYNADPQRGAETDEGIGSSTRLVRDEDELFGPLEATAGEIAAIERLYTSIFDVDSDAVVMLDQARASEEQFRGAAPHCRQLHIATHGFFADPDKQSVLTTDADQATRGALLVGQEDNIRGFSPGLLSGLAFAGANLPPRPDWDDGILTAEEIAFLQLEDVDLVTLSACETGLGAVAGGEGLIGVQRAFQVAGARTTIASLWKVDDHATRVLMEQFYGNLWEHQMSKLDALREAQLWAFRNPDAVRASDHAQRGAGRVVNRADGVESSSPYYWAAFVLSGDWR